MTKDNQEPTRTSTPFIAIAAHFYGTGRTPGEARSNLVAVGGSAAERQTVFQLPDGATDAYVANNGELYWYDAPGEAIPRSRYYNGKALQLTAEDKPQPLAAPPKGEKGKPRFDYKAALQSQDEQDNEEDVKPAKKPKAAKQEAATEPAPEEIPEHVQPVAESIDKAIAKQKSKTKTPTQVAVEEASQEAAAIAAPRTKAKKSTMTVVSETVGPPIEESFVDAEAAPKKAKAPKAEAAAKPTAPNNEVADFLLFIGKNQYADKAEFSTESKTIGVCRRLVNHRIPKGFVSTKSKVFLAIDGENQKSEVFGAFTPERIEFIDGEGQAPIKAELQKRSDVKVITDTSKDKERKSGARQVGGTYIVSSAAAAELKKPATYEGNPFRGLLRLNADQSAALSSGKMVSTLVDETCMQCGDPMKVAPDGHMRAERERRRIAKGHEPNWLLLDSKCAAERRTKRAADDGVASADETDDDTADDPVNGTP